MLGAPLGSAEACRAPPRALHQLSSGRASVGPHCFCRPDLTHGADSSGCASLARLQRMYCCLPPRRPTSKVYLAAKKGYSGLRLALQDPAVASLAPELASAGPTRGQVVDMRWPRAWDTSGCAGPPAVPSGPLLGTSQASADLGGHVEVSAHEARPQKGPQARVYGACPCTRRRSDRPAGSLGIGHEGMSMLSTEDGGDCSAARLLCDAEGCAAR